MTPKLTTHVLDTATGRPAAGMKLALYRGPNLLTEAVTNSDGRLDNPLLQGDALTPGEYRIEFQVGAYFAATAHPDARKFLDIVPVVFLITDPSRSYHIPLLVSPWAYNTYRGS